MKSKTIAAAVIMTMAWTWASAQKMVDSTKTPAANGYRLGNLAGGRSAGGLHRILAVDEAGRLIVRPPEFEMILTDTLYVTTDTTGISLGADYEALEIWTADTMTVVWFWLVGSQGDSVVVRQRPGDPFCYWGKSDTVTAKAETDSVFITVIKKRLRSF